MLCKSSSRISRKGVRHVQVMMTIGPDKGPCLLSGVGCPGPVDQLIPYHRGPLQNGMSMRKR